MSKSARHPDQFIQEFIEAPDITLIEQISLLIEEFLNVPKVHAPKNYHQAELTHHRQQALDRTRTARQSGRNITDPDSVVKVLLEVHIECVVQKAVAENPGSFICSPASSSFIARLQMSISS